MAEESKLSGLQKYREEKKAVKTEKTEIKEIPMEEIIDKPVSRKTSSFTIINGIEVNPDKDYTFQTLIKSPARRHVAIGSTCKIYDTTLNQPRNIRYVPTAPTIFEDLLPDAYKEYSDQYVGLYNNEVTVTGDVRLIEYLLSHDEYDGNPKRLAKTPALFTLTNREILEQQKTVQFTKEELALDVINKAGEAKLKPIARIVFNITDDNFDHIKNRLKEIVKMPKYPKNGTKSGADAILDNVDNPRMERKYVLQIAMDKGLISVNADKNSAVWGDTKGFICAIKNVKDSARQIEELTDYSIGSPAGEKFFELVKDKI